MDREHTLSLLKQYKPELARRFGVRDLSLFGSTARGTARDDSDVDLLVDEQLARVRARLKSMRALEKQLLQLRARCSGTHEGHCGILDELVSAAHGESCACHARVPHERSP